MKRKTKKIILISSFILFTSLLIFCGYMFYIEIIEPSIFSVKSACGLITEEELEENGYYIAGLYNQSSDEITIFYDDPQILKHELCHQKQSDENRLYGCDNLIGMYINEVECYIVQRF